MPFALKLPHVAFYRHIGEFSEVHADVEGNALSEAQNDFAGLARRAAAAKAAGISDAADRLADLVLRVAAAK